MSSSEIPPEEAAAGSVGRDLDLNSAAAGCGGGCGDGLGESVEETLAQGSERSLDVGTGGSTGGSTGGAKDGVLGAGDGGRDTTAVSGVGSGVLSSAASLVDSTLNAKKEAGASISEEHPVRKDSDLVARVEEEQSTDGRSDKDKVMGEGDSVAGESGLIADASIKAAVTGNGDFVAVDACVAMGAVEAGARRQTIHQVDEKMYDRGGYAVEANVGRDTGVPGSELGGGETQVVGESSKGEVVMADAVTQEKDTADTQMVIVKGEIVKTDAMTEGMDTEGGIPLLEDRAGDIAIDPTAGADQSEQVRKRGRKPKPGSSALDNGQVVSYHLPSQYEKKESLAVADLVWGKVKSHPWWPGQIFDESNASEMALKIQKKDHFLVAYFGDKTFAWCEESRLKPFQTYFPQMQKQSSSDTFATAVNTGLTEVSRRIEVGMTCHCLANDTNADLKNQKVENAGIREGTCNATVDSSLMVHSFQPDSFLDYVQALARCPSGGVDRLELVIAKAQLKAFNRSKGYPELPIFLLCEGLENDAEVTPARRKKSSKDVADLSSPVSSDSISQKVKSRGRESSSVKQKHILEDGRKKKSLAELMEEKNGGRSGSGARSFSHRSGKKGKAFGPDSSSLRKSKRKRLDSLGDVETKSRPPARKRYAKVGECMSRVAGQMTGSPPILKSNGETFQSNVSKQNFQSGDVAGTVEPHTPGKTTAERRGASKGYSSPSELLSQLCLAARNPKKGYSFLSMIVGFFTDFRDSIASSKNKKLVDLVGSKRGRKKSAISKSASSDTSVPDHMQDSYWSDIIVSDDNEEELVSSGRKRKRGPQMQRQEKKKKHVGENLQVSSMSPNIGPELATEGPNSNLEDNNEECEPTALILSFTESDALPSEADLIRIFGYYGSLRESETEVTREANRAQVVFKKRADAEVAFSSAGKFSMFGPALVSYRLRYSPSVSKASVHTTMQRQKDELPIEDVDVDVPVQ